MNAHPRDRTHPAIAGNHHMNRLDRLVATSLEMVYEMATSRSVSI
jgi:hypothetical protein